MIDVVESLNMTDWSVLLVKLRTTIHETSGSKVTLIPLELNATSKTES